MTKNSVCCFSYLRNHTYGWIIVRNQSQESLLFIVRFCKIMIYPAVLFIFSKLYFSGLLGGEGGGEGGKRANNGWKWEKIMSVTLHISGSIYHDCDFWFTCLKWWHLQMLFSLYLRNHTLYDCGLWYICIKLWCLQQFFSFFQNSDFFGF